MQAVRQHIIYLLYYSLLHPLCRNTEEKEFKASMFCICSVFGVNLHTAQGVSTFFIFFTI